MKEHSLEAQERSLKESLSALDTHSFLISFSMYLSSNPNTQNTLFFKSAALLSYLATQNNVEFNKLIQTLNKEDLGNVFVRFVVDAWESLTRYDTDSLRMLHEGCNKDFKGLMEIVLRNHLESTEAILRQNIAASGLDSTIPRDHVQSVRDCIFVVKNFSGN